MIRDDYRELTVSSTSIKDEERAIRIIMDFFKDEITEIELKKNTELYNIDTIMYLVKGYFCIEYNYDCNGYILESLYNNSINSSIYKGNINIIVIDQLLESVLISFIVTIFQWNIEIDNEENYGKCFLYTLFLLNEVCIKGEIHNENDSRVLLNMLNKNIHILELAEECFRTILAFTIAHEIAHGYLDSIGWTKNNSPRKEEIEADKIAYDIVLKIIMDRYKKDGIVLEPRTYLAPMMYMDFFDLYFYTSRVLYKNKFELGYYPSIKYRKEVLFSVVNRDEYKFEVSEGNDLYSGFLEVYDKYKTELLLKEQRGKLDGIKNIRRGE
ncbi:hypothetical protein [Intestinibacter sp.]